MFFLEDMIMNLMYGSFEVGVVFNTWIRDGGVSKGPDPLETLKIQPFDPPPKKNRTIFNPYMCPNAKIRVPVLAFKFT